MPHFFSIIQRLSPCKSVKIIEKKVEKLKTFLVLKVDNYICYIDLREKQKIKKFILDPTQKAKAKIANSKFFFEKKFRNFVMKSVWVQVFS